MRTAAKELAEFRQKSNEELAEFKRKSEEEAAEFKRKSEAEAAEFKRKSEEEAAERRRKSDEEAARRQAELARQQAANDEKLARLRAENELAEKAARESMDDLKKTVRETSAAIGRLGNRVGELIEQLIIPKITEKFQPFGFNFVSVAPNVTWKINGKCAAEVDVFLSIGDAVMAIEVKTQLTESGVETHLRRLERFHDHAVEFGLSGKKIYGAVTAPLIETSARDLALRSGLFVIEQPDEKDLKIIAPSGEFAPKAW
jgi:multidrug efflux pump subunit AcrA (membrane-fusion protein)